ncbi:MAG: hypothetical protein EZS28_050920 [Streblomastix strix]|uniref:Uncharacterized protein n=1 Tax=Streblomastix strix TaxID=222440 RepID=A0A5J4T6Z6_9EUKA|nr:MAG: hypothetical protein EZS28_050920 [Streblomastix strix]
MGDSNYNRLLRNKEKCKTPKTLFNKKRRFIRKLRRKGTIMRMLNANATLSNFIESSGHIQSGTRVGKGALITPIQKGQIWWQSLMRITICWKELRDNQNVFNEGT